MSQRQEMEQTLALESQFRESLFQALPVPVFLRDNQGEIIKRNKQAKRLEARYLAELHLPQAQLQGAGRWPWAIRSTPMPRSRFSLASSRRRGSHRALQH